MAEFRIEGLDAALKTMKGIAPELQKNGLKAAARRAMRVVRDAARRNAKTIDDPRTSEKIWKNITIRAGSARRNKKEGGIVMRVGVAGGARNMEAYGEFKGAGRANPGGDTWYWRLIEFGAEHIPARPFMRPALSENVQEVTAEFTKYLGPQIDKAIAKAHR